MEKIRLAELIATGAHYGQVDKGNTPYIEHPRSIANKMNDHDAKIVAWLHDVVEDTNITLEDLKTLGFPGSVIDALDAITRRPGEGRELYINRVAGNRIATMVKLEDLLHNSDLSRINQRVLTEKDYNRVAKYKREIEFLRGVAQWPS